MRRGVGWCGASLRTAIVESGDFPLLTHIDDADVTRALAAAAAAQPLADLVDGYLLAEALDQRRNTDLFHALAVGADGVELEAFEQVTNRLHTVCLYSIVALRVN